MSPSSPLAVLLRDALPPPMRERTPTADDLEAALAALIAEARRTWPDVSLRPDAFIPFLAERLQDAPTLAEALERCHASDLYLTCACLADSAQAVKAFKEQFFPYIRGTLHHLRLDEALVEDVQQQVFQRLFVEDDQGVAKAVTYTGRGSLRGFVRVTAMRVALNLLRRTPKERLLDDAALADSICPDEDQELAYFKRLYRHEFKASFQQALARLSVRERNLLRYQVLDHLDAESISRLHDVHRTTVSRWLRAIRDKLLTETRRALASRLQLRPDDVESIIRLIQSHLDVSFCRVMNEDDE